MTVDILEAETKLPQMAESAANGEDVILLRDGQPIARIVSMAEQMPYKKPKRKLGLLDGQFSVPVDIKTPFKDEIEEMFYGNPGKFDR